MSVSKVEGRARALVAWLLAAVVVASPLSVSAETRIKAPRNFFDVKADVQYGREAAQQAEQKLKLLRDREVQGYVERVGQRLVAAIPAEFQHPEFRYTFKVVDDKDINAFALPGGPLYVNRGMIESARSEGELAGVLAHEISHVALRHGTAQVGQAYAALVGLAVLSSVLGKGKTSEIATTAGALGLSIYLMKFSRKYETQADILGAQIMARAGYDPRDLANVFLKLERTEGSAGPQWLSDHPNPGNRYERIMQETALLNVSSYPIRNTSELREVQARLRSLPRARDNDSSARERNQPNYPPARSPNGRRVEYPSSTYRSYTEGSMVRLSVPDNWRELAANGERSVTFAPEGAYATVGQEFVFTHGVQVGVASASARDLRDAARRFVNDLLDNNSYLKAQGGYSRATIDGREALGITLAGESDITGQVEVANVYTAMLEGGELFYMITVTPESDSRNYAPAFQNVLRSLRIDE